MVCIVLCNDSLWIASWKLIWALPVQETEPLPGNVELLVSRSVLVRPGSLTIYYVDDDGELWSMLLVATTTAVL